MTGIQSYKTKAGDRINIETKDIKRLVTIKFADGGEIVSVLQAGSKLSLKLGEGIIGDIDVIIDDAPED